MTWNEIVSCITSAIERNPRVGDMPALVCLHAQNRYETGQHEVSDIRAFDFDEDGGYKLSMSVLSERNM